MTLEDRLAAALANYNPISKKMFGGTCFMLNGNMAIGTFKGGILARIGKDAREALKLPGAAPFEMRGRMMEGCAMVAKSALVSDAALARWIDLCIAFNKTLPAKSGGARQKRKQVDTQLSCGFSLKFGLRWRSLRPLQLSPNFTPFPIELFTIAS